MYKLLITLFAVFSCYGTEKFSDSCVSCSRILYLDLGESRALTHKNFTEDIITKSRNSSLQDYRVIQVQTCPACIISVKFRYLDIKDSCWKRSNGLGVVTCRCDYIWFADSSYEEVSGTPFCGYWNSAISFGKSEPTYKTQTKSLTVTFFFTNGSNHKFLMYFTSQRNQNFYSGTPQSFDITKLGSTIITSPFFPAQYPPDLMAEYIITYMGCFYTSFARNPNFNYTNDSESCRIRLLFTDFHLAESSVMEFLDDNQMRIELASGLTFRPPVITTNSSRLRIRFNANGGQNIGFRALVSFVQGGCDNPLVGPNTDCGGLVEDLGGAITMVKMVRSGSKAFDCVWLIRPSQKLFAFDTNLFLRVNTFANFDGYAELDIREGQISESPLLEKILQSSPHSIKEHVTSPSTGFYVNLKGIFGSSSVLGITFASFHFNKCFTGPEFLCRNQRCIPRKVVCDGFDHCGDNSDESDLCYRGWRRTDRKWNYLTPNYYFPKTEHHSELKIATLVFIVSSLGLILFLATLIILLYRIGIRSRQQTNFQSRLQTITDFLDDAEIEEIIDDEPPLYEAPPDYEAAVTEKICIPKKPHAKRDATEICSLEGRIVIIPAESSSSCSNPKLNEGKDSDYKQFQDVVDPDRRCIPASPPPPYAEDESCVINCLSQGGHGVSDSVELQSQTQNAEDRGHNGLVDVTEEKILNLPDEN